MVIELDDRWLGVVDAAIAGGRFRTREEVVHAGLRAVQADEAKLAVLRAEIAEALAEGGEYSMDDVRAALSADEAEDAKRAA